MNMSNSKARLNIPGQLLHSSLFLTRAAPKYNFGRLAWRLDTNRTDDIGFTDWLVCKYRMHPSPSVKYCECVQEKSSICLPHGKQQDALLEGGTGWGGGGWLPDSNQQDVLLNEMLQPAGKGAHLGLCHTYPAV